MPEMIVLNGTSSAGKSTLAKALQEQVQCPVLHAGIDHYLFMLPKQYLNPPLWQQVFEYEYDGERISAIRPAALAHQLMSAMHHAAAALADAGFDVIIDHVLLEPAWLDELRMVTQSHRLWLVGVRCPLEVAEARERSRQDRTIGQAAVLYRIVHRGLTYDYEVDTSLHTPVECAKQILDHLPLFPPV